MMNLIFRIGIFLLSANFAYGQTMCRKLYYPFTSNADEVSNSGINGQIENANLTLDRNGNPEKAYSFNGSNAYINLGNNPFLKRYQTDFTIAAWVYLKSYSSDYRSAIVSNRDTNSIGSGFSIGGQLDNPGKVKLEIQGGENASSAISKTILELNKWYFVAVTFSYLGENQNIARIYINENLESTGIVKDVQEPLQTPTYIGHEPSKLVSPLNHFDGTIDEVRIYNCALSAQMLYDLYKDCNHVFYTFSGDGKDSSSNKVNGTVMGATLTMDRNGNPESAYSFDGSNNYINLGNNPLLKRYQTDFTISAWVYLKSYSSDYRSAIVSNRDTNSIGSGFSIGGQLDNPGKVKLEIQGGENSSSVMSKTILELNKWYFVAVSFTYLGENKNLARIYINESLENTGVVKDVQEPLQTATYIGHEPSKLVSPLNHFNGSIDEVRIYNCALTIEEILENYIPGTITSVSSVIIKHNLEIFPNPALTSVTIRAALEGVYLIRNQMGQLVRALNLNAANDFHIEVSGLPAGIYSVSEQTGISIYTKLVVVE